MMMTMGVRGGLAKEQQLIRQWIMNRLQLNEGGKEGRG